MNTNVFLAFPPGSGGNHLRNILLSSTDFFYNTATDIEQIYSSDSITVHCKDTGTDENFANLTEVKLKTALNDSNRNYLFYGHFAELFTFKNIIQNFENKKIICISVKSDNCKKLLNQRKQLIGTPQLDAYHMGEQTFLYESLIYQKIYNVLDENIMDISISEFFLPDLSETVQMLEYFLDVSLDITKVNTLHHSWLKKNCLLTTHD